MPAHPRGKRTRPPPAEDPEAAEPAELDLTVLEEFDTPTEVDAAFRTQRKVAIGYFVLFLLVTLAMPALTIALGWWSRSRLLGGMSPAFVMAAGGLYVAFLAIAAGAASLANAVEDAMLGGRADASLDEGDPRP